MPKINLLGSRFDKLIVIGEADKIGRHTAWICQCDCGNLTTVTTNNLRRGHTTSCGCKKNNYINLAGHNVNRLTVLEKVSERSQSGCVVWLCLCDCGKTTKAKSSELISGKIKSCGCLLIQKSTERIVNFNYKHGLTGMPVHNSWRKLIERCQNPNYPEYHLYGGRGIKVCDRWLIFENFLEDMGHPPKGYSIERVDVNGYYEPSNCRWATPSEQARNRRSNRLITINGITKPLIDWCEEYQCNYERASRRIRTGWEVEFALTTPPYRRG